MTEILIDSLSISNVIYTIRDKYACHIENDMIRFLEKDEIVSQSTFDKENAIYVITNGYSLKEQVITIPIGCVLFFFGGNFINGSLQLNDTKIIGDRCFDTSIQLSGTVKDVDINWFIDDFHGLKTCCSLAESSKIVAYIDRDLKYNWTETIRTSCSVDFKGHKLSVNTNNAEHPRIFEFCNTVTEWILLDNRPDEFRLLIDLVNSGKICDYPEKYRDRIFEIYSNTITEVNRYEYGDIYLNEMLYIDSYGDLHGEVWNKDIPYEEVLIRMHKKLSNGIFLRNCNIEITFTNNGPEENYMKTGIKFVNCVNPTLKNITLISPNVTQYIVRENGTFEFSTSYNLTVSNVYCKSSSIDKNGVKSSYGFLMYKILNGLFQNVRSESMNNHYVWGITGSNLLYNMTYRNCILSRIDTHWRCVNMTVDNCKVGYFGIHYTGSGVYNIVNSDFQYEGLRPREEYGTYFDGVINITNCRFRRKTTKESESASKNGIVHIAPYIIEDYKMRGRDKKYIGARQINISNVYIDCPDESEMYSSLVSFVTINPKGDELFAKHTLPNISIKNVTYNGHKNRKAISLIYAVMKGIEFDNVPTINVDSCIDTFSHIMDNDYTKPYETSLCMWDVSKIIFPAKLNISNSNVFIGEEPTSWDCNYTNCVIDGFYATHDVRWQSTKTFNNCIFKFDSDKDVSPFSTIKGPLLRFYNCIFDAPTNENHYKNAKEIYEVYDIDNGWSIGQVQMTKVIMTACMPSDKLCEILGKNQKDFININNVTKI